MKPDRIKVKKGKDELKREVFEVPPGMHMPEIVDQFANFATELGTTMVRVIGDKKDTMHLVVTQLRERGYVVDVMAVSKRHMFDIQVCWGNSAQDNKEEITWCMMISPKAP